MNVSKFYVCASDSKHGVSAFFISYIKLDAIFFMAEA